MNALEVMKLGKKLGKDVRFTTLDLPTERQRQLAKQDGYEDLVAWQVVETARIKRREEWMEQNPIHVFDSIEEAEAAGFVVPKWQKDGESLHANFHKTLD